MELIGGIPKEVLYDIANNISGEVVGSAIHLRKGYIAVTRLGPTVTPDPLGTTTAMYRPTNTREAIQSLNRHEQRIRAEARGETVTPPLEWFYAVGQINTGIMRVTAGTAFRQIGHGLVGEHFEQWKHYVFNNAVQARDLEERERAEQAVRLAEKYILLATGFTPQEISDYGDMLEEEYHGQQSAPFEYELFEQYNICI